MNNFSDSVYIVDCRNEENKVGKFFATSHILFFFILNKIYSFCTHFIIFNKLWKEVALRLDSKLAKLIKNGDNNPNWFGSTKLHKIV